TTHTYTLSLHDALPIFKTILEGEGIKIRLGAECIAFEKRGDKVAVQVDCSSGDKTVIGSHTLLAVGRVPNTNDLGLEHAGIAIRSEEHTSELQSRRDLV